MKKYLSVLLLTPVFALAMESNPKISVVHNKEENSIVATSTEQLKQHPGNWKERLTVVTKELDTDTFKAEAFLSGGPFQTNENVNLETKKTLEKAIEAFSTPEPVQN